MGMIVESSISEQLGLLNTNEMQEVSQCLLRTYGKVDSLPDHHELLALMMQDKKNVGAVIKMALISKIGSAEYDVEVSESLIRNSIDYYNSL